MSTTDKFDSEKLDFRTCVPRCEESDMNRNIPELLRSIQKLVGFNLLLTSGYRSREWEFSRGRSGTSSHCKGLAIDVDCPNGYIRQRIITAALALGVPRIGIGPNFIHLDIDETKPFPTIWLYDSGTCSRA